MIGLTNAGGGFDRLNMRVYGGLSTPLNPRNNDVWVKIEQKKFTYIIDGENASFTTSSGMVRLKLASKDIYPLMVLKNKPGENNKLYLDFTLCELDIGPTTKVVDAYVRKDSEWKQFSKAVPDWDGTLFYNGNQYEKYTGGWNLWGSTKSTSPNLSITSYTNNDAVINSNSAIDLTKYSKLKWTGSGSGANSEWRYAANCAVQNSSSFNTQVVSKVSFKDNGTYSIDISGISGTKYIVFWAQGSDNQYLNISKIWLE